MPITDYPTAPNAPAGTNDMSGTDVLAGPNAPARTDGPVPSKDLTPASPPLVTFKNLTLPFLWQLIYFYYPNVNIAAF